MGYKLALPTSSRVHPIFHVSCLKKVIDEKIPVQTMLLELDEEGKFILEPEEITKIWTRQLRNRSISEYFIKWKNLPTEDSTWEDESFIQQHPKLLQRWGQHFLKGSGMLSPYWWHITPYSVAHYPLYCGALHIIYVGLGLLVGLLVFIVHLYLLYIRKRYSHISHHIIVSCLVYLVHCVRRFLPRRGLIFIFVIHC